MPPSRPPLADEGPPPLIIVSAGRSGSTLLHELLAHHERVSWLSPASDRAPERPERQRRVVEAAALPLIGRAVRRRWPPDECYGFWSHHFPGFVRPMRDLTADDVMRPVRAELRRYFEGLTTRRRPTLLLKVTGWPRAGFLANVLEGARFLHIVRDGREVARSLLTMPWWLGWHGPSAWRFGPLTAEESSEWDGRGRSFAALAAIQWRRLLAAAECARSEMGADRWLDIRYEDLCDEPRTVIGQIMEFGDLPGSPTIQAALDRGAIRPAATRWDTDLSSADRGAVEALLRGSLDRWSYE